jgi:uncharacterized protein with HEPN domain
MPLSPLEYLKHILDEMDFLIESQKGIREEDFFKNTVLQRAFTRSLEIIGEASKKVDPEFKKQFPDIPWKPMAQMRDKLIHDYFGIDFQIVWDIVTKEIPKLQSLISKVLSDKE